MGRKRWGVLALCCGMLLCLGILYIWSTLVLTLEHTYHWSRMASSGVFTVATCSYCGGLLVGGALSTRTTVSFRLLCAGTLLAAGFALAALFPVPAGVYPGYGILCNCGVGIAYNTLLGYCGLWFPDKPGLCNGLMLMCFGLSTFFVGGGAAWLIGRVGWQGALLALAVLEGAVLSCGALVSTRFRPEHLPARSEGAEGRDIPTGGMLRSGRFYLFFIWLTLVTAAGLAATGSASQMALALEVPEGMAALLPGALSAVGAAGRLGFGRLFDWAGYRASVLVDSLLPTAAMAVLTAAFLLGGVPLLLIGFVLVGVSYGGMSSLSPLLTGLFFGRGSHYPRNFSVMALEMIPASLVGSLLGSSLYVASGSYAVVCLILLGLELAGVVLALRMAALKTP